MQKLRKSSKTKEKKLEKKIEKILDEKSMNAQSGELAEKIKIAAQGLVYISETDAEISLFAGKTADAVNKEEILKQTESSADNEIEEKNFAEFFAHLTETQDWYGDEEKETVKKFAELKLLLEQNLRELKVFKIGKVQLNVYVVGLDAENTMLGVKTKSVET